MILFGLLEQQEMAKKQISENIIEYIVTYINRYYPGKEPQESLTKEIERLLTIEGLTEKEQDDCWKFYLKYENREFDSNDKLISFKPFYFGNNK